MSCDVPFLRFASLHAGTLSQQCQPAIYSEKKDRIIQLNGAKQSKRVSVSTVVACNLATCTETEKTKQLKL